MRITGPYRHRAGYRYRVTEAAGAPRWAPSGRTEEEARELAEGYADGLKARGSLTVAGVAARYLAHLQAQGNKPHSVKTAARQLVGLDLSDLQLASVTPLRAKAAYHQAAGRYAVATHHLILRRFRALWTWAIEEGLTRVNPWTTVRVLGRAKRGKPQLTLDEAAKLSKAAEARGDDEALGVLLALHMGLRNAEIRGLNVRDLDLGGKLLRVQDSKTQAGRRALEVPHFLRHALLTRTGRPGSDPLLLNNWGQRPNKNWLGFALRKLCDLANVPRVVPHSLRGLYASLHYEEGVDPNLTARKLGHRSPKVTQAHYATAESRARGEQKTRNRARSQR